MFIVFDPIDGHYPFYLNDVKDRKELYEAYESYLPQPKETILEERDVKSNTRIN
ncbi:hypothetical protein [Roseivirga sp.]|uniref:hypothetical protein n=1 Tax=Roseivirga sp. TaxID=1964215 RepID=UPI002B26D239|nr:hypothetical protein [Roseivirga sp.]